MRQPCRPERRSFTGWELARIIIQGAPVIARIARTGSIGAGVRSGLGARVSAVGSVIGAGKFGEPFGVTLP